MYRPKLLEMNDGISYAYSNTVMQYLVHNAITNRDIIGENISYAKSLINFRDSINYWSDNVKYSAFMKFVCRDIAADEEDYRQQSINKMYKNCNDVTGYIDTQIEEWLNANIN